jgi:serine/threonine-protein kinase
VRICPDCQNSYADEVGHCPKDGLTLGGIEPEDELIGRAVGSYRIVRLLGKGGMGSVYLGEHPVIGSRVAVKFLHPWYSNDAGIVDRFFNEARAVNLIGHDNILKILDLDVTDDHRHYFVMEYLRGRPLQSYVRGGQPVPLGVAGPILLQCCAALQAAHDKGIVHRDLKPDNVYLIAHDGRKNFVKLVDFGIAKLTAERGAPGMQKTQTGMVMGTPGYMSPEQGAGAIDRIDGRSDVYSLGVMMYQLATGRLPFSGANFGEVLMGHLQRAPLPPRSIEPSVPPAYEAVILRCLAKEQRDRFQSMGELRLAIASVLGALGIGLELPAADEDTAVDLSPPAMTSIPSAPGPRTPPPGTNPGWGGQVQPPQAGRARGAPLERNRRARRSAEAPPHPEVTEVATQLGDGPAPPRMLLLFAAVALGATALGMGVVLLLRGQSAQPPAQVAAAPVQGAAAAPVPAAPVQTAPVHPAPASAAAKVATASSRSEPAPPPRKARKKPGRTGSTPEPGDSDGLLDPGDVFK